MTTSASTPALEFRHAIREALDEAMSADESVIFYGEDVAVAGGVFAVTPELLERHGADRVFDTPISELAMTGAAFGSAICGLRPVVEIMFGDFLALSMDSLVNQAAKWHYLSNGQVTVPLVIRSATGGGGRFGAIHSQLPMSWFNGVPGLKIVCPAFPSDAKVLLRSAIEDDNPVLFFEHKRLYSLRGPVEPVDATLGAACVRRDGTDLTLVSVMRGVHDCLRAADGLAAQGVSAEVIDLRSLRPWDRGAVLNSVAKTNRLIVVEEGPATGGWAGEVVATVAIEGLADIDDILRLASRDQPVPYSPPLEDDYFINADDIVTAVVERL